VKTRIFLVVGCPGSGKSWCLNQLRADFHGVEHDVPLKRSHADYVEAILRQVPHATKPLLTETPFGVSDITVPLKGQGLEVVPMFIIEEGPRHRGPLPRSGRPACS
jgi:hypothetical protein